VLTALPDGGRGTYQFSGVTLYGQEATIRFLGSDGVLVYDLLRDTLRGASRSAGATGLSIDELTELPIPPEMADSWRVEADFIDSIRTGAPVRLTDFATGVQYMEFTEAVARSARSGAAVELPLAPVGG
jgi:predicted dehydrogenase